MIEYKENSVTPEEFESLYNAVGWGSYSRKINEEALKHNIYSISAYHNDRIVGFGRIVGDNAIFLYIQDVMVIPEYQSQKIGTEIMKKLLEKIDEFKKLNPSIRVYLGASKDKEEFYKKFGFVTRKEANLGDGMILK